MNWYVVVTKPKAELKVKERLQHMGVKVCCPSRIERRQWSDRVKKVEVPLLPSMVLVHLNEKDRVKVFDVPGVVRYLFYLRKPAVVPSYEVEVLENVSKNGVQVLGVKSIQPGDVIEVPGFGTLPQQGVVKQVSSNQCWVVLKELGFVVTLRL